MISYSSQGRDHAIDLIISAIRRAIEFCRSHDTLTATIVKSEGTKADNKQQKADVHESDDVAGIDQLESKLKAAVIAVFGSARAAFDAHSKDGVVSKKEMLHVPASIIAALGSRARRK